MKGQTQAVTAVLITGVIVGSVASAYVWGVPLVEKRQGRAEINSLESSVKRLESSITGISDSGQGSSDSVTLKLDNGNVRVDSKENYIEVTAYVSGATYPQKNWKLLRGQNRQGLSIGSGKYGTRGKNTDGVVMATSASGSGSMVKYRVEFRNLKKSTPSGSMLQQVDLQSSGATRANGEVEIYFSNEGKEMDAGSEGVDVSGRTLDRQRTIVNVDLR